MASRGKAFFQTLSRWRHSRLQRRFEWQFVPLYWKFSGKRDSTQLSLQTLAFRFKYSLRSRQKSAGAFRSMLGGVVRPALLCILLILTLELVGFLAANYGGQIFPLLPAWVGKLAANVNQNIKPDPTAYVTLFSTSAQVAGTFLALYFAAVSVIVSTVYTRVQGDVR